VSRQCPFQSVQVPSPTGCSPTLCRARATRAAWLPGFDRGSTDERQPAACQPVQVFERRSTSGTSVLGTVFGDHLDTCGGRLEIGIGETTTAAARQPVHGWNTVHRGRPPATASCSWSRAFARIRRRRRLRFGEIHRRHDVRPSPWTRSRRWFRRRCPSGRDLPPTLRERRASGGGHEPCRGHSRNFVGSTHCSCAPSPTDRGLVDFGGSPLCKARSVGARRTRFQNSGEPRVRSPRNCVEFPTNTATGRCLGIMAIRRREVDRAKLVRLALLLRRGEATSCAVMRRLGISTSRCRAGTAGRWP
jgi:hypothetical protein